MFVFKISKSEDSSYDQFERAIFCAKDCIVSVLDTQSLSIEVDKNSIIIKNTSSNQKTNITLTECKEKVKGCFYDASGNIYPEFIKIKSL